MTVSAPLADGYHGIAAGKLAAVVTSLEMTSPPPPRGDRSFVTMRVVRQGRPEAGWYRDLFARVGTPWLWTSRLKLTSEALSEIIEHPDVAVFALMVEDRDEGLLELDFRQAGECELTFFGVTPAYVGTGAGRHLMTAAVDHAWARPIRRFWVHTCSLDHPAALAFYVRSGFVPFRRQVEVFDDPRSTGVLPENAAPNVPKL